MGHGDPTGADSRVPKVVHALDGKSPNCVLGGAEYSVAICDEGKAIYSWGWCGPLLERRSLLSCSRDSDAIAAIEQLLRSLPKCILTYVRGVAEVVGLCCRGDFGRLGHEHGNDVTLPRQISSLAGKAVASVSCGDAHTLVVLEDGKLMGFGRNQNGQIGNGKASDCFECTEVQSLQHERIVGASCGAEHSLCVTAEGSVYAWGWGRYGNLGIDSCTDECVSTNAGYVFCPVCSHILTQSSCQDFLFVIS